MTKLELLELLENEARRFRADRQIFKRNQHMHKIKKTPPQDVVDAVLVLFINTVGNSLGVDYAMYAKDLLNKNDDEDIVGRYY